MARAPSNWPDARLAALCRTPGTHKHPVHGGLILRVSPKLKAVWALRLFPPGRAEVNKTLGEARTLSQDQAIQAFLTLKERYSSPTAALTLNEAFTKWLPTHRTRIQGTPLAPATLDYYREAFERYLSPTHGERALVSISVEEWLGLLQVARARSVSQARGTFWGLKAMLEYYTESKVLPANPVAGKLFVQQFSGAGTHIVRRTTVPPAELRVFVQSIQAQDTPAKRAVMALLLSGWRLSAILQLRRADLDLEKGLLVVGTGMPGWKLYRGPIVVGDYLRAVLEDQLRHCPAGSAYVFPARHGAASYMQDVRGTLALSKDALGRSVTAHDLRRTFSGVADVVLHGNLLLTGRLLGQSASRPVTADYMQRVHVGERRSATVVQEAILSLADQLPEDEELLSLFEQRGVPTEL